MADYTKWTEKTVPVTSLFLDPQNPRLPPPTGATALDQRGLIAELVEHEKVLDLAKDISENGYAPVESLIGIVEDDGKTYVLEGNRRLAALKLLISPDSAPDSALKRVKGYAKEIDGTSIQKVRVLFAPSRKAAAPLIMQKHTRQQIERWAPLMQARFYKTLADLGMSAADMAREYGSTPGEVAEFLRTHATYELASRLDLPAAVKEKVDDRREFPVSVLQRIVDTPKARERLGIDFDANGAIKGSVTKEEFARAFKRILSDIANDKINTRTINKAKDVEDYLTKMGSDLPDKKKKGNFTAADFEDKSAVPPAKPASPPGKPPAGKPKKSKSVVPTGARCAVKNERINEIFSELRGLKLDKNPNASAVLFRILLELAIGNYLDITKKIEPLLATAKKDKKPSDWYPTLRQMLDAVLKDHTITTIPPLARKKLNKLVSDKSSSLSVDGLDSYVHNRYSPPSARDLRAYWEIFEGLFEVVLVEPPRPGKP